MKTYFEDGMIRIESVVHTAHHAVNKEYLKKFVGGEVNILVDETGEMIGLEITRK